MDSKCESINTVTSDKSIDAIDHIILELESNNSTSLSFPLRLI